MPQGPARLHYLPGEFDVEWPGDYVVCAVTGQHIALEDLKYWSVERQEAYVDGIAATRAEQAAIEARLKDKGL